MSLDTDQMPAHSHGVNCAAAQGTLGTPVGNFLAGDRAGADDVYHSVDTGARMNPGVIAETGSSQAHANMQPFLGITYVIALQGIFPSRN